MALLLHSLRYSYSSSFSSSSSQLKNFGKTKILGFATRSVPKQYSRRYAVSPSTPQAQEYHFDPNDVVLQQLSFEDEYGEKIEKMRELVEWREEEDPTARLMLVDTIQRLGVGHHFEKEIEMFMKQHYLKTTIYGYHSLHHVALSFRLLRQRGYDVSADVFENFKGKDGKFRDELKQDIWGLLELYEATQLSFEGESILEEAADFSSQILHQHMKMKLKESNIVEMRLRHPYHKTITKVFTNNNFPTQVGGMNTSWMTTLTELSELDLLTRKHMHKHELLQISKWWNDLGLNRELEVARNQPVKWYTWSMAVLMGDMSLSEQRVQLTKSIAFVYFIDDVFDLYGTLDELEIFTEAVNQWEYAAIDMLPEYMKKCYKSLLDTTNQIANTIYENHGHNPINTLKQTWGSLCNAFLVEAKWLALRNLPRAEEYLTNGKVSSGVQVGLLHLFFLLGLHEANLDDVSTIISRVATILRLWDDLGSPEDEHQTGRDGSYIECYMRDKPGVEFEEAREHVVEMIGMEWKRLNKECFDLSNHHSLPSHDQFQEAALNVARMVPLMYSYDHNQRLPLLKQYVHLMLLDPPSFGTMSQHKNKDDVEEKMDLEGEVLMVEES